ncbi:MAG TPA: DNA replication/repair protein RecF [Candidatus Sumerlaeota bacterium]|nr:DNA replication/repair protein RecF [Candidatus Sumerlaeota bacterium]HPS02050.1 DNA replication/repair protein RecF [Candidatus Sumerlaeota bacterium]
MHLESLRIDQFRCVPRFARALEPGGILIVGDNASGKTSLLEAVFYLVTGRSFRTRYDNDCVPWGSPSSSLATIQGRVRRRAGDSCRLVVALGAGVKSVRIDDKPLAQLAGLWGHLQAVLFTPDDLQLIKGAPGERRRYLDMALSQIDPKFLFHLQRYNQALRQRNALLKRSDRFTETLRDDIAPWDEQLIEHGAAVMRGRQAFLAGLEPRAARIYALIALAGDTQPSSESSVAAEIPPSPPRPLPETLSLRYAPSLRGVSFENDQETRTLFRKMLHSSLEEDVRRNATTNGPHRDDFLALLSGKPTRDFGSQGQVRSCVLALRLAEVQEMEARTGDSPLVLLDDVASELDPSRKKRVLELLDPVWQTFMTTTRPDDFPAGVAFTDTICLPHDFEPASPPEGT